MLAGVLLVTVVHTSGLTCWTSSLGVWGGCGETIMSGNIVWDGRSVLGGRLLRGLYSSIFIEGLGLLV